MQEQTQLETIHIYIRRMELYMLCLFELIFAFV